MSEGLAFADPIPETPGPATRTGARRALVFLDSPPAATPDRPFDPPAAGRPDTRLAAVLRAEGFTVDARPGEGARADGGRVWDFLRSAGDGDVLMIRLPGGNAWTSGQLGSMIGAFGRRVGESAAAAVLLVMDFGWSALDGSAPPVRQLGVAGEPRLAAAALTLALRFGEPAHGPAPSLTGVLADGLAALAADPARGAVTVGDLHAHALRHYAAVSSPRTPILLAYGPAADVPLTRPRLPAAPAPSPVQAAFARTLTVLGDPAPPASGTEIVRRVYELHLSEHARQVLRGASLLEEGEPVEEILGDAAELRHWGLLGETALFAHPDVRAFGYSRLSPAERARTSALLRRWRAGRRAVQPRARLTADRWTTDDQLGHRIYAEAIAAFVRHPETRPPLTIGVKGPWGAGKTSLMRMIQDLLDPGAAGDGPAEIHLPDPGGAGDLTNAEVLSRAGRRRRGDAGRAEPGALPVRRADWRPTVWFNPWMYQSGEQVWAGLAHEIISQVTRRLPRTERERFWLELNLSRIDPEAVRRRAYQLAVTRLVPLALGLLAALVLTGALLAGAALLPAFAALLRNAAAAVGAAGAVTAVGAGAVRLARFFGESAGNAFSDLVSQPDLFAPGSADGPAGELLSGPGYRSRAGFLHLVQTDMRQVLDLVATEERPLVVFVDDLDRCSPGTVAQVIEAINLFLAGEFPNCVFVLAMEPEVVAAHVEAAYRELAETLPDDGRSGLGWRFLEKIVQLPLSVPLLDDADRLPAFVRALLGMPEVADAPGAGSGGEAGDRRSADPGGEAGGGGGAEDAGGDGNAAGTPCPDVPGARTPLDVPLAVPRPGPPRPPDPSLVSRLEDAIWALRPTAATLDEAARRAQEELGVDCSEAIGGLATATREAADRVFDELYSDENAYRAIEFVLPALMFFNPREIKRYVNVFRFYSFIAYRRTLAGAAPASDGEVAKLAALTIHWPHLLTSLARETGGTTALERLEGAAGDDDAWERAVRECGLAAVREVGPPGPYRPPGSSGPWGPPGTPGPDGDGDVAHLDPLRNLLRFPHPVAALARHLL
ncbi:P-loop NTPase fold protein [Streptosporangium sandarakinum]